MRQRARLFIFFARTSALLCVLFAVVFYGADYLSGQRSEQFALYFDFERALPFYGPAYIVYYSVFLMPFAPALVFERAQQVRRWAVMMATVIVVAGVVFVLLPTKVGYPVKPQGVWSDVNELTQWIAGRHNLVPSLHVALSLTTVFAIWSCLSSWMKRGLVLWSVALSCSAVLTHQHHLLDVVCGLLLAVLVHSAVTTKWRDSG